MKIYTGGSFNLFHEGHVELLEYCRTLAGDGTVTVALNTDDFIARFKGKAPTMTYSQRRAVLLACKYVDQVIPNYDGEDSKPSILDVKPDMIVIGMDWLDKDYCKQMSFDSKWLNDNKIALCYVPRTTGTSTTKIKEIVKNA
jgi:glycerol-3-phosphate cytidylyltransferase